MFPARPGWGRWVALIVVVCLLGAPAAAAAQSAPNAAPFDVAARSAVLYDVHTGQVLYAKNPDERLAPASLAKIMTMLLALEAIDAGKVSLSDRVTISENAWRLSVRAGTARDVSVMFIQVGEQVSVEELLYGIGVSSGNDASLALAEFLAGNEQVFVDQMNRRAQELGLENTHFVDSHGLSPEAYTTALDMAKLAAFFVRTQHDGLVYASKPEFTFHGITQPNRNGLVMRDDRVTGLKTGHLSVAGYHLVATAQDGEMSLVASVLGTASDRAREEIALQLLNYGFRNFRTVTPAWGENGQKTVPVYKGAEAEVAVRPAQRLIATVPADQAGQITLREQLPAYLEAPVSEGQVVGKLALEAGGQTVAEFDLVTA
ncbi:MAG TPA: D-alanyl-D-alanine carboxypeptidase family protein, partial [Bacillota bacterium]